MNFEKVYTLKELETIVKDYKLIKVEDLNGKVIQCYNKINVKPEVHIKTCLKRLSSPIHPEGYYYLCMAHSIGYSKQPDKYLFTKGNAPKEMPATTQNNAQAFSSNKNDLLTVSAALNYISEIAELKNKVFSLETENKNLKDENAVLNAELEEMEREGEGLSEKKPSDTLEYLKETAPTILNALDRYFELQDKRLSLEEKKINTKQQQTQQTIKRTIKIETGSPQHLNLIRSLYNKGAEDKLNIELDKLESANNELYLQICNELNLIEDENSDSQ